MTPMGRPKTYTDLPPHMTARHSGGRVLYYYQAGGVKVPLGADKAAALKRWAELEGQGTAGGSSFAIVAQHFERVELPKRAPKTQHEYRTQLVTLTGAFGHLPLQSIRPVHVRQYLDRRSRPIAANREIALLSRIWNWARAQDYTSAPNPCTGIDRNAERKRDRYVTDAEYRAVRDAAAPFVADSMELMLLTAQRPSDVLRARLSDVRDGELWFRQSKTGTALRIAVSGPLRSFIDRAKARDPSSLYLVADSRGQRITIWRLEHAFAEARATVGADWQLRDLRKKATTDEPDLTIASQRAGHADEATTAAIYRLVKGRKVGPGRGV